MTAKRLVLELPKSGIMVERVAEGVVVLRAGEKMLYVAISDLRFLIERLQVTDDEDHRKDE